MAGVNPHFNPHLGPPDEITRTFLKCNSSLGMLIVSSVSFELAPGSYMGHFLLFHFSDWRLRCAIPYWKTGIPPWANLSAIWIGILSTSVDLQKSWLIYRIRLKFDSKVAWVAPVARGVINWCQILEGKTDCFRHSCCFRSASLWWFASGL